MLDAGAPVDGFGVGTALATSRDAPALGGIYKLVEIERDGVAVPVMKLSGGKTSYPGRKQVWRRVRDGAACGDVIGLEGEPGPPDGVPLLAPVIARGQRVSARESLDAIRSRHAGLMGELPADLRTLTVTEPYPAVRSHEVEALADRTARALRG
jgi:nicotinate phosphoribosyltransferase